MYYPTIPREKAQESARSHLLKTYFDNSVEKAVTAILETQGKNLSDEELKNLSKLIDESLKGREAMIECMDTLNKSAVVFASLIIIPVFSTLVDSYDVRISRAIKNEKTSEALTKLTSPVSIDLRPVVSSNTVTGVSSD